MSANWLPGITHAIVTVPSREVMMTTGTRAVVDLCFGPGDDNAIGQIRYVKHDDEMVWTVPHVPDSAQNAKILVPVIRGQLLVKACEVAAKAVERVKKDIGVPQFGARYRVFAQNAHPTQLIDTPEETAA